MSADIIELLNHERRLIIEEKKRLGLLKDIEVQHENCDNEHQQNNNVQSSEAKGHDKENVSPHNDNVATAASSLSEKTARSEIPTLDLRSDDQSKSVAMLRYGEYSPNNPQLRVTAAPYIGLGEYEQRRNLFLQKQRADYLEHLSKKNDELKKVKNTVDREKIAKYSQTDIQNIHCPLLVQYELQSYGGNAPEKELSPRYSRSSGVQMQNRHLLPPSSYNSSRLDQRLTSAQNALLKADMDNKPKSILSNRRTGSPRERLMSDLKHSYTPSFLDGFSNQDRGEELERERMKRDTYQQELRLQIEEKRHMLSLRDEQERREQELENRRLEQQLLRMQEEQMIEEQRRNRRDEQMRRHSEDLLRRKHELQGRTGFRKHTDSESSVLSLRNTNVASTKPLSHYSPPVSRRNPYSFNIPSTSLFADPLITSRYSHSPSASSYHHRKDALNRMDSLNTYNNAPVFNRFDSLSRIDSLDRHDNALSRIESLSINDNNSSLGCVQRRHSATQQDLSVFRRSPKLQRRSSSGRFDDALPIPVLKAHSPVAKELKHSVPFNSSSRHSSDAVRMLEDKWQIPAVQKNIINHSDPLRDGRSILTQLGAIRMQLQQEQLRMDETLRKRGLTQSNAVDFH